MAKTYIATLAKQEEILAKQSNLQATLEGQRPKRYGYRVSKSNGQPAGRVEYLYDAVGMTPAKMDYSKDTFNYGSWENVWFIRDNYPVLVGYDGKEKYQLNRSDQTKKFAVSASSGIQDPTTEGNFMSAIPTVWVKRYEEAGYEYVIFCEEQYDDGYKAYAHTRQDGTIAKMVYAPMFKGTMVDNKIRSLGTGYPQGNTAAQVERTAVKANGEIWEEWTWSLHELIADLLVLIGKSTDSQGVFGQGTTGTYVSDAAQHYGMHECGTLVQKGQFYGKQDTSTAVKVFYIEDFWGNRWDRVVGCVMDNGNIKVKMTPEGGGYNLTGEGYTPTGITFAGAGSGSNYYKETKQSELGKMYAIPSKGTLVAGSSATYDCDYFWWNAEGVRVLLAGGYCTDGAYCGARCLNLPNTASHANWYIGASLSLQGPSV